MRVRFRRSVSGIYAGVSLSQYSPGVVYGVDEVTGARLLDMGAQFVGPEAADSEPILTNEQLLGGVTVIQSDAADRQPRKRIQTKRRGW